VKTSDNLLGVDVGTSGLKVSVFTESGELLGQAYRASCYLPLPEEHREQRPEQWWDSFCDAAREGLARAGVGPSSIRGIGLCGFQNCPVFVDEDGSPTRPAMLLHDGRLPQSRREMAARGTLATIETLTRSMVSSAHFPPIYHYVRTRDPEAVERTRWILLAKDYLRFRLTGLIATELCDATGTNLILPGEEQWSDELCDALSVPREKLPPIAVPTELAGVVSAGAAGQCGLATGTPVAYGGGDSHCALLGLGCTQDGDLGMLLGTNATLRAVFDTPASHPLTKVWTQQHVVAGRYTVSASSMAGGSVLQWFRENFYPEIVGSDRARVLSRLEELASGVPAGSDGVVFLPYIHGERAPFYDPDASGAFLGIRRRHGRHHLLRSVLEGIALNIANCHELVEECARPRGTTLSPPRLGGGGSGIPLWHQIMADCLARPIRIMSVREAGTLGAALLAGVAVGLYSDCREAVARAVRQEQVVEPRQENLALYAELRQRLNDYRRRCQ